MSGNSQEKQPVVRPGLVVILLVALGGALYWRFFFQPKPGLINRVSPSATVTQLIDSINGNQPSEAPNLKINPGPILERDLFLPPPLVIAARRSKDNTGPSNQPVRNEPQLIKPDQEVSIPVKIDENPEKPVLKGIMGTADSQLIIVRYQNKSYLLKLGEILPGTQYRVAKIDSSSVILLTPKGHMKLDKKERAE